MIWLSFDLRFKWFARLSSDLGFKWFLVINWFGISSDLAVIWFEIQMILVVNWFAITVIWLSVYLGFKWFYCKLMSDSNECACHLICDSNDLVAGWLEIQVRWLSVDLRFKWFEDGSSKTKLFCETSFKIETLKLKNKAFLRDFLQTWNFKAQKRSFSARGLTLRVLQATKLWKNTAFRAIPTRQNLSCLTSALWNISAVQHRCCET